ncbi:hypothetical protein GOV07_04835 [Candidatus Woesearchaeota archaeon]|nr:hypothetical protein [Candidatus Woesearchaeota archaeon]
MNALEKHGVGKLEKRSSIYEWETGYGLVSSTYETWGSMVEALQQDRMLEGMSLQGKRSFPHRIFVKDNESKTSEKMSYLYLLDKLKRNEDIGYQFRKLVAKTITLRDDIPGLVDLREIEGFLTYKVPVFDATQDVQRYWIDPIFQHNTKNIERLVQDTVRFSRLLPDWGAHSYHALECSIQDGLRALAKQVANAPEIEDLVRSLNMTSFLGRI